MNAVTHGLRAETLYCWTRIRRRSRTEKRPGVPAFCRATTSSRAPSMTPSSTRGCETGPGGPRPHGWPRNIANAGVDQARREADEVLRLGQKLFADNRGPLAAYPHVDIENGLQQQSSFPLRSRRRSRRPPAPGPAPASDGRRLPVDARPVVRAGVDPRGGLNWQSADKLKAVRLLGRQPIEAVDDRECAHDISRLPDDGAPGRSPSFPRSGTSCAITKRSPTADAWSGGASIGLRPKIATAAARPCSTSIERATAQIKAQGRCASTPCRGRRRPGRGPPVF